MPVLPNGPLQPGEKRFLTLEVPILDDPVQGWFLVGKADAAAPYIKFAWRVLPTLTRRIRVVPSTLHLRWDVERRRDEVLGEIQLVARSPDQPPPPDLRVLSDPSVSYVLGNEWDPIDAHTWQRSMRLVARKGHVKLPQTVVVDSGTWGAQRAQLDLVAD
jgi:hypothetical protein